MRFAVGPVELEFVGWRLHVDTKGEASINVLGFISLGALVNEAATLGGLGRAEDATAVYDEVEARFGDAPEVGAARTGRRGVGPTRR